MLFLKLRVVHILYMLNERASKGEAIHPYRIWERGGKGPGEPRESYDRKDGTRPFWPNSHGLVTPEWNCSRVWAMSCSGHLASSCVVQRGRLDWYEVSGGQSGTSCSAVAFRLRVNIAVCLLRRALRFCA